MELVEHGTYSVLELVIGITIGYFVSLLFTPTENTLTYLRNLAAGIVFAAASTELIPKVMSASTRDERSIVIAGMVIGLVALITIRSLINKYQIDTIEGEIPWESTISLAIDFFIDSFIIGITSTKGVKLLLGTALATEMFMLTLTLNGIMKGKKVKGIYRFLVTTIIIIVVLVGGTLGYYLGENFKGKPIFYGILAFGLSVLIWLIMEELLVYNKKNSTSNSIIATSMLFLGFIGVIIGEWIYGYDNLF